MKHFPVFLDVTGRKIVLVGGGQTALAKLRILLKTPASIAVFTGAPADALRRWQAQGRLSLFRRGLAPVDVKDAALIYAASDSSAENDRAVKLARQHRVFLNVVDNLAASDFLTPAIVDRTPVTVAIGTEGSAPVLARRIKSDLERRLPANLGQLARMAKAFRPVVSTLKAARHRRQFWQGFFCNQANGYPTPESLPTALGRLQKQLLEPKPGGKLDLIHAPHPDQLPQSALRAMDGAEVVILLPGTSEILLELTRREAAIHTTTPPNQAIGIIENSLSESRNTVVLSETRADLQYLSSRTGATLMLHGAAPPAQPFSQNQWRYVS